MKQLTLLLFLISSSVFAQIEIGQDTLSKPSRATTVRLGVKDNNFIIVPKTGNSVQVPSVLKSITDFNTYTQTSAIYDGSIWNRISGVTSSTAIGYGSMFSASVGGFHYERQYSNQVSVKWFGAKGDNVTDDATAINNTIAFATVNMSVYKLKTVFFPDGYYLCNTDINAADKNSICLTGAGGRSLNTVIVGNSGGITVDLSGSSESVISHLSISVPNGLSNPAKVGVQFALNKNAPNQATAGIQKGGLNCKISDVCIKMGNFVGINNGLGAIALVNCRSEEMAISDVTLQANTACLFTVSRDISTLTGYNYIVSSSYTPIQDDANGSMGVVNWSGQNSIHCWERLTPGLLLNGVNSFNFHGYIGRINNSQGGSYESAFRIVNTTYGLKIHATIESYSQMLSIQNSLVNADINITTANHGNSSVPLLYLDNYAKIAGSNINVSFGNPGEINNGRIFLFTPLANSGNDPTNASIKSSVFNVTQMSNNAEVISSNLLKNTDNSKFNTDRPFEKIGTYVSLISNNNKNIATVPSGGGDVTINLSRFNRANKADTTTGNAGFFQAEVSGNIQLGNINTTNGLTVVNFEGWVTLAQNSAGTKANQEGQVIITSKSNYNGVYLDVSNIQLKFNFTKTIPTIDLVITTSGTGTGENISFVGDVKLLTNFKVNQSVIID